MPANSRWDLIRRLRVKWKLLCEDFMGILLVSFTRDFSSSRVFITQPASIHDCGAYSSDAHV